MGDGLPNRVIRPQRAKIDTGKLAQKPSIFQAVNPEKAGQLGHDLDGKTLRAGASAEMEHYGD
jgi:hypothetical protein